MPLKDDPKDLTRTARTYSHAYQAPIFYEGGGGGGGVISSDSCCVNLSALASGMVHDQPVATPLQDISGTSEWQMLNDYTYAVEVDCLASRLTEDGSQFNHVRKKIFAVLHRRTNTVTVDHTNVIDYSASGIFAIEGDASDFYVSGSAGGTAFSVYFENAEVIAVQTAARLSYISASYASEMGP